MPIYGYNTFSGGNFSIVVSPLSLSPLKRGLIEGDAPHYIISLGIAKNTHQLPSYTKTKGLDKEKLRQMILQYLKNAGGRWCQKR